MTTGGQDVPPDPGALIESMRAFGYSLPTAIADLVDNSITAGSTNIQIRFEWAGADSSVAVSDDGCGMDEPTLIEAMRLGSRSPTQRRSPHDLGRFGLGLKSAAWSQARTLTVITKASGGGVFCRRWDLDHVSSLKRWELLDRPTDSGNRHRDELRCMAQGTTVVLENADRLVGTARTDDSAAQERFFALVRATAEHLGMLFHRFLTGRNAITITVNSAAVEAWDPFLTDHPATQPQPTEDLRLGGRLIHVVPYVLPHVSKLDSAAHSRAAGPRGWNAQQGFYVYRANRLLVAGEWLGLKRMQQEEHFKLARIRVDLDNAMDEAWQIDVRKATARIPGDLQPEFRRIAQVTRRRAAEVYRFRGKVVARASGRQDGLAFVWERFTHRDGARSFRINRRHPVVAAIAEDEPTRRAVERAFRLAEENVPVEAIVMEAREHPDARPRRAFDTDSDSVRVMLERAHTAMCAKGTRSDCRRDSACRGGAIRVSPRGPAELSRGDRAMSGADIERARELALTILQRYQTPTLDDFEQAIDVAVAASEALGDTVDREHLRRRVQADVSVFVGDATVLEDNTNHHPWLDAARADVKWRFWEAYRDWSRRRVPPEVVTRLHHMTDDLLGDSRTPGAREPGTVAAWWSAKCSRERPRTTPA